MFCRKCGKQIPDDSNVCQYCGVRAVVGGDESSPEQTSPSGDEANSFQNVIDGSAGKAVDGTANSAQESTIDSEIAADADISKTAKPKNKTIAIVAVAAAVVAIAVIIGAIVIGGQGSSNSAGSAGNAQSEPIVGEWKVCAVSTDDDDMSSFTEGGATIRSDGSVSVNLTGGGGLKMSGTWKAEPKTNWPDVDDLVGYYDLSLTVEGKKGSFTGAVTKSGSEYTLFLLLTNSPDTSMVFTRAA